jgi:DNA-binding response OmpR family regulator
MSSANVLVVDDDAGMRGLLNWMLVGRGYAVTEAASVDEAVRAIQGGAVDVVILDLMLGPRKSGLDVLRLLRSHAATAWLPVIILTGTTIDEEEEQQIRSDEAYVFYKPVDTQELLAYVDRLVQPPIAS